MDPNDKVWIHIAPVTAGEYKTKLAVCVYQTEDELLQSHEFLNGHDDIVLLVSPNDVLACGGNSTFEPASDDLAWNLQLKAFFSSSRRRKSRFSF